MCQAPNREPMIWKPHGTMARHSCHPMNPEKWTLMDDAIDDVLRKVRAGNGGERASLQAFIHVMDTLADQKPSPPTKRRRL